ncbi:MAG: HEAT repeat domain-containing protein, partial [Planctomycetaceae bacterium]|nr:HEAT repeat domain-containing protein [Planctomycetaceae bacterium]
GGGGGNPFDRDPAGKPAPAPEAGPAVPGRPSFEDAFKEAEAYERKHRADAAGIMERYHRLMADYPEALGRPEFMKAAERAGKANAGLKDVYRKMRDADPDSLKAAESPEVTRMILVLGKDVGSQDSAVRERAARMIGMLGSGEGVFTLVKAMKKEKQEQTLQAMAAALVSIGGAKATEQVASLRDEKDLGMRALDVLQALTGKNAVDRRLALREIGGFAKAKDEAVAGKAVDFLVGLGPEGAHGLVEALDSNNVETKIKVIAALGATKNPQVAKPLSNFLIGGDVPNTIRCREAAMAAIEGLGEPAVPYLFHGLRNGRTKMYTGFLLHKITGERFSSSRPGDWVDWYKRKHPDWKPGKEEEEGDGKGE